MRITKSELRARVHDHPITFGTERISSHGGLELVRLFLKQIDFSARVRAAMGEHGRGGDYGFVGM